jgi:L-ascorbate metabolism protein UlaG (beta-lactamase superfamily)
MAVIRFLGTAAFEITADDGTRVLMDPFLDENPVSPLKVDTLERPDLLLVTHAAYDHFGDTQKILDRFPDLPVICGSDVRGYLMHKGYDGTLLRATPWSMMIEEAGVRVRPVETRHWSYIQTPDGLSFSGTPTGFIVYVDDQRIYHSGDTTVFGDMKLLGELYEPTVGLLNVGVPRAHTGATHGVPQYLSGEMDAREAAMAASFLGLEIAIPCHHDDCTLPEIVAFEKLLNAARESDPMAPRPHLLDPGESLDLGSPSQRMSDVEVDHEHSRV